jgi:uncharacterized OB-fold protein
VTTTPRLRPVDDDLDTGGFFDAARRGAVAIRRCNTCDAVLHMPVAYCRHCGSWDGRWQDVAGTGTLHSWTVVHHQVHPAYPVPYTVVLVDLDELPATHVVGRLDGSPELRAGQPMEAWFEQVGDTVLPNWRPAP